MKIDIFTEGSNTTADKDESEFAIEYFQGLFSSIEALSTELSNYGDVSTHILSDEFGYITGNDRVSTLDTASGKEDTERFKQAVKEASENSDVVIILLAKSAFSDTILPQWDTLVNNAKQGSIWCIGASETLLSDIDIAGLRSTVDTVIVYQRVGVARIGTESKEKLIETVSHSSRWD